jgi:hypothetical protein
MLPAYGVILRLTLFAGDEFKRMRSGEYAIAWYVVPLLVLLALGGTVVLGAMAYCIARGRHLSATANLGGGRFLIGCSR